MALTSLCHQKFCRMVSAHGCPYMKFNCGTNTCDPVSETESSVLLLIHTKSDLEKQINEAQTSENEVSAQVKSFLKAGRRQVWYLTPHSNFATTLRRNSGRFASANLFNSPTFGVKLQSDFLSTRIPFYQDVF